MSTIKIYGDSHIGLKRKDNQDSFLIDTELQLYAVADGMGGHKGGAIASQTAIKALQEFITKAYHADKDNFSPEVSLEEAFLAANQTVYDKSQEDVNNLVGMGTTLVAAMIYKKNIFFANVGDSRAYLFREPHLWRVTEDHSILNNRIKKGLIDEDNIPFLADSNVITRSIGFILDLKVDIFQREIKKEDFFLLCSDGLTCMINDEKITQIFQNYAKEFLVKQLIDTSLDAGGNDNISVIVIAP